RLAAGGDARAHASWVARRNPARTTRLGARLRRHDVHARGRAGGEGDGRPARPRRVRDAERRPVDAGGAHPGGGRPPLGPPPLPPRPRGALDAAGLEFADHVQAIAPLGYLDLAALASQARVVLTDSGGLQKEAYWYGIPCVTLRPSTEWVDTVEVGANVLVDDD